MRDMKHGADNSGFAASQDVAQYVDYAKQMRDGLQTSTGFKSFCIIPDIVAIDIHLKYKIDVHDDEQMQVPATWNRVKQIIKLYYPYLLTGGISNRFNIRGL